MKIKKEGKTYYWCKWHNNNQGQWVLHHPSKCTNCSHNKGDDKEVNQDQAMAVIEEEESVDNVAVSSEETEG